MITFKSIQAQNFMSFKELSAELENQGIVAIEGQNKTNSCFTSNGAGKSTLLEAFVWGVWGETIRPLKSVEDVVNDRVGKDCSVHIPFRDNDEVNWEIRRYRNHHEFKNKVLLFREGEEWTKDVKIQDKINSILGIDYKSFKSAFIFYNDGTKPFSACTDSEQKKLLEKLFDLEKYTGLLELTKVKTKNLSQQHAELLDSIKADQGQLNIYTQEISNLEIQERQFSKDIEATIQQHDNSILKLSQSDNSNNISVLNQEIDRCKIELELLKSTDDAGDLINELDTLQKELDDATLEAPTDTKFMRDQLEKVRSDISSNNFQISLMEKDLKNLKTNKANYEKGIGIQYPKFDLDYPLEISLRKSKIKELCDKKTKFEKGLGIECPNCNQEITSDYKQKHVDEISLLLETAGEELLNLTNKKESLESTDREIQISFLSISISDGEKKLQDFNELKIRLAGIESDSKDRIKSAELSNENIQKRINEINVTIGLKNRLIDGAKTEKRKKEDLLNKQIESSKDKLSSLVLEQSNNLLKISMIQKQKEQYKTTINPYTDMTEKKSQVAVELFDKIEKTKKEESDTENLLMHYQFFEQAFSRSGIQSYLLDNIIPTLNKYAKHYADILSGGSLHIEFCNQSTNKAGDAKEKFSVLVKNRDGSSSYEGDSSGERRRVDLIALFALQKASMLRSKSKFNVLFIDELFDSLDVAGIEQVIHILEDEIQSFPSIFLISHNPEIAGYLDSILTVVKEDGFSRLLST